MAGIKEECGVFGIYEIVGTDTEVEFDLLCSTEVRNPADLQFLILRENVEM